MKYLIHNGETYYPGADEFDNLADAVHAFKKLRSDRLERIEEGGDLYFSKDYLCIVIDENDPIELAKAVKVKNDEG